MRTNTLNVLQSFLNGKSNRRSTSIWTDGVSIYSYDTCLVTPLFEGSDLLILNMRYYTRTTADKQRGIAWVLSDRIARIDHDAFWGVTPDQLRSTAQANESYRQAA